MAELNVTITGMSCGHCVKAVEKALDQVHGVQSRSVQVGSARITFDPAQASPDRILEAIREEGYQVEA